MRIKFVRDSVLKKQPVQSSQLKESDKVHVLEDWTDTITNFEVAKDNHLRVTLTNPQNGSNIWYVFNGHCVLLSKQGTVLTVDTKKVDLSSTAPQVKATKIPDNDYSSHLPTITIPGIGKVNEGTPVFKGSNFTWGEATHGGSRIPTAEHAKNIIYLAKQLQPYRDRVGKSFHVTSWYRPEPFNARAGGVSNSTHLAGLGIDFYVDGLSNLRLWDIFNPNWEGGVGIYGSIPDIIHLDARSFRARW